MKYLFLIILVLLTSCRNKIDADSKRLSDNSLTYFESENWKKVLDLNNQAIIIDEGNYIAYNNRAMAKFKLGYDSIEVFKDINKALDLKQSYSFARHNLIVLFFEYNNYKEVIQRGEKYLEKEIRNTRLERKRGNIFLLVGESHNKSENWSIARKYLSKALEIDSLDLGALKERGISNRELNLLNESLSDFNRAIKIDSLDIRALKERGITYRELNLLNESLTDLNKAIKLNPNYLQAINNRGLTLLNLKKYNLAIEDFSTAIKIDSTVSAYWFNRGACYIGNHQLDKGCTDMQQALNLGYQLAQEVINKKCN